MASLVDTPPQRPSLDELRRAPRPRSLPIIVDAPPARRELPLRDEATAVDQVRPVYCVWEITLACDLACRHCGSRAGRARPEELDTRQALELCRQIVDLGVKEVTLIGGEVYLRSDWLQIVSFLAKAGLSVSIATGGRGITRDIAQAAKDAGLRAASVSIDGLREAHDRLRAVHGAFASALSAMGHIKAAGLHLYNNSQINRLSIPDFPELFETLIAHGTEAWQIMVTVPMGRAADEPDVLLQPYDLLEVFPVLARIKARADEAGVTIWRGNTLGYFGPYESLFQGWTPRGHGGSCGAGKTTLGIEADGTIKGCPSLGTVKWGGGNVRDASLEAIWTRAEPLRYTRTRTTADLWGYCAKCYYADTCRAGCTWMSDMLLGRPGNNPYCHHRALEMQRMGKRERVVQVEAAPGQPFDQGRFEIVEEPIVSEQPTNSVQ
ncbi:MAG TPA: radical SAM protein [Polyangiaceae bacterium]|nr:radical SAM protein [Polyangiaceae bacterium]